MHYVSFGKGIPIVFLHGWGGNKESFLALASHFKHNARVILVDFEHNVEPSKPLTLNDYVLGVKDILEKEGIDSAYFVAHSFGGRVAVRLCKNYPSLVKGMVLIDSAGLKPRRGIRYHFKVFLHKTLKKLGKVGLLGSSDYRKLSANMKKTFVNVVNDFCDNDLKVIDKKVLILWGKKDRETPLYMGKRYRKLIPSSRLIVFKRGGHFSYLDYPMETISLIKSYISGNE